MKRLALRAAACAWMTLAGLAGAEPATREHPLRIELDLVDGSRVVGAPALTSMTVRTTYAGLNIPLAEIRSVDIADDHEQVSVVLQNGDHVTGVFDLGAMALKTVFGDVSIPIVHVVRFDMLSGTPNEGLVLHYTFDDDKDGNASSASRSKWTDYYFDGLLDELQLWNRALSNTEVRQLYDSLRDK